MALAPRLEIRQGQALVMTPQLQQAIKLLQLSNIELSEFVAQELERNPLLEEESGNDRADAEASRDEPASEGEGSSDPDGDYGEAPVQDLSLSDDAAPPSTTSDLDTDFENVYADASAADRSADAAPAAAVADSSDWQSVRGAAPDGDLSYEATLTRPPTLAEHLTDQMLIAIKDPAERMIAAYLIDQVNEAGYLTESPAEAAERLGTSEAAVEAVVAVLQTFEPTGICARNLRECLALQLKEKNRLDPAMELFLDNLELFARRDIDQLVKLCGVDKDDISGMVDDIRQCNPKPGLAFGTEAVQPVVPDVFIRESPDGGWAVELNSETLPRVLVNNQYHAEVSRVAKDAQSRAYLSECLTNANWLIKSLDQRARTILKVASEIARQQDAFLAHGVEHLKPLNLKTIAEAISMHESTVSRVTANKYVATPRGLFELKYFFTSAIPASHGGEAHSAEAVRHKIKELIDQESGDAILSDDAIVDLLRGSGVEIARRTVAKYREAMNIPSSVQRRREKRAFA